MRDEDGAGVTTRDGGRHGVDFAYHANLDVGAYYKRYVETFLSVDEGIGRIIDHLTERGELDDTLLLYLGDNGFMFGKHGLIDKRTAYEESMRIPMLAHCPALFAGGTVIDRVVANLDIAPWPHDAAGPGLADVPDALLRLLAR